MNGRLRLCQALLVLVLLFTGAQQSVSAELYCGQSMSGGNESECQRMVSEWCRYEETCTTFCDCYYTAADDCEATYASCNYSGGGSCSTDDCFETSDCCEGMGCVGGYCENEY